MMNDERQIASGVGKPYDLRKRTKAFALGILRLYTSLPRTAEAQILGKQMLRSGTSVGAHYREATRARSQAEFISKVEVGLQELEEVIYWLELMVDGKVVLPQDVSALLREAEELTRIFVRSVKTAKSRKAQE